MNYKQAQQLLQGRKQKKLASNTYLRKETDCYVIKFHDTDILKIYPKFSELSNGNFYTTITKERLNEYHDIVCIKQSKKRWYIVNRKTKKRDLFFNGIQLDYSGNIINPQVDDDTNKVKTLDKLIKDYIDGFCKHVESGKLEYPSGGDCWYCHMMDEKLEKMMHVVEHLNENYFVPSFLYNIIKLKGYNDSRFVFEMIKTNNHPFKLLLQWYFRKNYNALLECIE